MDDVAAFLLKDNKSYLRNMAAKNHKSSIDERRLRDRQTGRMRGRVRVRVCVSVFVCV